MPPFKSKSPNKHCDHEFGLSNQRKWMFERSSKNGNQNLNRSSENQKNLTEFNNVSSVLSVLQHLHVSFSIKITRKSEKNTLLKMLFLCEFAWSKRAKFLYEKMLQ